MDHIVAGIISKKQPTLTLIWQGQDELLLKIMG